MNNKVCIKGDGTAETGKRIIEYLEGLGGVNKFELEGTNADAYYIIDHNNVIAAKYIILSGYELITLPEPIPEKTFPREMLVWDYNEKTKRKYIVDGIYKGRYVVKIDNKVWIFYMHASEIEPPKPLTTEEKIADLQRQIDKLKNMMG